MFATFAAAGHFEGKVKFLEVDCIDGGKKAEAFCGKHGVRGRVTLTLVHLARVVEVVCVRASMVH
jgi:hypothetical protein